MRGLQKSRVSLAGFANLNVPAPLTLVSPGGYQKSLTTAPGDDSRPVF
jgi:hypothetical protein